MDTNHLKPVIIRELCGIKPLAFREVFGVRVKRCDNGWTFKINESDKGFALYEAANRILHMVSFVSDLVIHKKTVGAS